MGVTITCVLAVIAIVVPEAGPLPLLLALLRTLVVLSAKSEEVDEFLPEKGDWIRPAGDKHSREFGGYFASTCPRREVDDPREANFFAVVETRGSKRREKGIRYQPLQQLKFWEDATATGMRRRASHVPGEHNTTLGPLERIFHRSEPSRFSSVRQRVILVSTLIDAKRHLEGIHLLGQPLGHVIPTTRFGHHRDLRLGDSHAAPLGGSDRVRMVRGS